MRPYCIIEFFLHFSLELQIKNNYMQSVLVFLCRCIVGCIFNAVAHKHQTKCEIEAITELVRTKIT